MPAHPPDFSEITAADYNARIRDVERALTQLLTTIQPAVAKTEASVETLVSEVGAVRDELREMREAHSEARIEEVKRDVRLAALESDLQDRKQRSGAILKWAGGIAATVVAALLLVLIGIGKTPARRDRDYGPPSYSAPAAVK